MDSTLIYPALNLGKACEPSLCTCLQGSVMFMCTNGEYDILTGDEQDSKQTPYRPPEK